MLITTFGCALQGIEAIPITVEVNWLLTGKSSLIVGLPDSAVRESLERIESAFKTNGFRFPRTKLIINLAPADIRKNGTAFDLPIALGILGASGQLEQPEALTDFIIMGELSLTGAVRGIKGALPIALQAIKEPAKKLILPLENLGEAACVDGLTVWGAGHLSDIVKYFAGQAQSLETTPKQDWSLSQTAKVYPFDFSQVKGQYQAKRALEIAAAGGHHALLVGAPGAGKTMLAKRVPSILPAFSFAESIETTRIYSAAGKARNARSLLTERPFRSPHHSISDKALIGGGALPQPGEISLAHHGVLFLDELPEFKSAVLDMLRQPLEERKICVARMGRTLEFPASFMLIAAMNPCPCGYYSHPTRQCQCAPGMVKRYLQRLSGPLLDRIDLQIEILPVEPEQMEATSAIESSQTIRERVERARQLQADRMKEQTGIFCNAQLEGPLLEKSCSLDKVGQQLLRQAMEKLKLSARAYERIIKIARTIADLEAEERITPVHVAEAIQYRSLDRDNWAV
ncbi:MAG: YifB family Mg chelatase-like AAA ATPase [Sphingomonadales bacterium]